LYGGRLTIHDILSRLHLGHKRHRLRSLEKTNHARLAFRALLASDAGGAERLELAKI
jgi:hypothetical protein